MFGDEKTPVGVYLSSNVVVKMSLNVQFYAIVLFEVQVGIKRSKIRLSIWL